MKIFKSIKFWWRKQPNAIKVALIAGFFSLLVAFLNLLADVFVTMEETLSPPHLTAVVMKSNFNWTPLFLTDDRFTDTLAFVVTSSCLQISIYDDDDIYTEVKPADSHHLKGALGILVMNDRPLVITRIDLKLLNYTPLQGTKKDFPVFFEPGRGGGGSPVNKVMVTHTPFKIGSRGGQTFTWVSDTPYEMPANGAMTFMAPVEFLQDGFYTYQAVIEFQTFHSNSQYTVSSEVSSLGWVYIDHLAPERVVPGPSESENLNLRVSECP